MEESFSRYSKGFERAVAAALSGATVLTANTRSARAVVEAADRRCRQHSQAWASPDVLPYGAFLERLYGEAVVAGVATSLPLGREQELGLWRQIAARSAGRERILLPDSAAELASGAFRTATDYGIRLDSAGMSATVESREFAGWAAEFRNRLARQGWSCAALLTKELCGCLPKLPLPRQLFAYWSEPTPAQREFLSRLEEAGVAVEIVSGLVCGSGEDIEAPTDALRYEFGSEAEELRAAAQWARRQCEAAPGSRVGVIFFDLSGRVAQAESAFLSVLEPERLLGEASGPAFEIALPQALADYPMVRCALGLLSLLAAPVDFYLFDATLRSPYLAGEAEAVARFLTRVRRQAHRRVSWDEFTAWLGADDDLPALRAALTQLPAHAPLNSQQPVEAWAEFARAALDAFGWPKGVALDSAEFQCLESWGELFASIASLEALDWRTDFAGFVARLARAAATRGFKPETRGAWVQIMDAGEAEGSCFDALWIGGCSDDQWPALPSLSPLLPSEMQKAAGVPAAGTARGDERVRAVTARLLQSAPRVALSLALRCDDEREQRWSPLFAGIPLAESLMAPEPSLAARFTPAAMEAFADASAPPLAPDEEPRGGTSLLEEQSNCPFRAFAIRRLHARRPEGPQEAMEASLRGRIVELAMQRIWEKLGDSAGLERSDVAEVIERSVDAAMAELMPPSPDAWTGRLRELERQRNIEVIGLWFRVEARRSPFRVLAHQRPMEVELAGMKLRGRLDRLDEVGGVQVVIDYKTGKGFAPGSWSTPRPLRPQLPFYALAMEREGADVAGVAFATIRRDEQAFRGYLREKALLPVTVDPAKKRFEGMALEEYLPRWKKELERIAGAFVRGDAAVDPKFPPGNNNSPCRRCHLQALCRVGDLFIADEDETGEEAPDA